MLSPEGRRLRERALTILGTFDAKMDSKTAQAVAGAAGVFATLALAEEVAALREAVVVFRA